MECEEFQIPGPFPKEVNHMSDTSVSYTCPNCGGPLSFAPGEQKVLCPYCDTEFDVKTIEELFAKKQENAVKAAGQRDEMEYPECRQ